MTISVPMGTIVATALPESSIPEGWLLCDGSPIPYKYQQLITFLGTPNTPNLIGRVLVGAGLFANAQLTQTDERNPQFHALSKGDGLRTRSYGGECMNLLTISEMPNHHHDINNGDFGLHSRSFAGSNDPDKPYQIKPKEKIYGTDYTGGSNPHYNIQPYYSVNYIICAVNF